jgi:hypothetical protein
MEGEYFHECSTNLDSSTPKNSLGFQIPHSGVAYSGFLLLYNPLSLPNYKEYIETSLDFPLIKNRVYCAAFYYSIAEYASNRYYPIRIGMLFTDTLVYRLSGVGSQPQNIIANSQIFQQLPAVLDTQNWIKVEGCFVAKGGEQYLTIGNFDTTSYLINRDVYLFIDDVKVWLCDTCQTPETGGAPRIFKVYPNPAIGSKFTVEYVNGSLENQYFELYDVLGQKVFHYHFGEGISKQEFNLINLSSGVYFYTLRGKNGFYEQGKLIFSN